MAADQRQVPGALIARVRTAFPAVVDRIPPGAAARLAHTALGEDPLGPGQDAWSRMPAPRVARVPASGDRSVLNAARTLPAPLRERLFGALELTVAGLDPDPVPGLPDLLPAPLERFAMGWLEDQGEALKAAAFLAAIRPGALQVLRSVTRRVAADHGVAARLAARSAAVADADVETILATHGAARLALAVVTVQAVLAGLPSTGPRDTGRQEADQQSAAAATVVGVALGVAVDLYDGTPPPGYLRARDQQIRADYRPGFKGGQVRVADHRFGLLEAESVGDVPALDVEAARAADVSDTGLVAVVPGGLVLHSGTPDGHAHVSVRVEEQAPPVEVTGWDEVVEVSWRARNGHASVVGSGQERTGPGLAHVTPPWPGDYRARVHVTGRDDVHAGPGLESFLIQVWPAPPTPPVVHRQRDRLGHRLRGEPDRSGPDRSGPEHHGPEHHGPEDPGPTRP